MDVSSFSVERSEQFEEVCSKDFLEFKFGGRGYQDQLNDSIAKTQVLAAVKVEHLTVKFGSVTQEIVWVTHNFGFLGGSLGCAEGEKITRAFEYALEKKLPVCVQVKQGAFVASVFCGNFDRVDCSTVPLWWSSYAGGNIFSYADG
jgi:acetyl-CoA carboxylase beta subunit